MVDVDKTLALICAAIYVVIDLTYLARLRTSMARDVTKQKESWGTRRLTLLRREMQDRLESALLDNSHYVFLQRMSLIAPLMGVIITAQGFIRYFVPSNDDAKLERLRQPESYTDLHGCNVRATMYYWSCGILCGRLP